MFMIKFVLLLVIKLNSEETITNEENNMNVTMIEKSQSELTHLRKLGIEQFKKGHYNESVQVQFKILTIDPNNEASQFNIANIQKTIGQPYEAINFYNFAIKINPNQVKALYNSGNTYQQLEKFDEAIGYYRKCIDIDPIFNPAYVMIANCQMGLHMQRDAIIIQKLSLNLNPDVYTQQNLGIAQINYGQFNSALHVLKKVIDYDPMFKLAYSHIADIYFKERDIDQSIKQYLDAVQIDPEFKYAYHQLILCQLIIGNKKHAQKFYKQLIIIDNENQDALNAIRSLIEQ